MNVDESNILLRRIYFRILDLDGNLVDTAASAPPAGTIQVTQNGTALTNGAGVFVLVGSGLYYYEASLLETHIPGFIGVVFSRTGFQTCISSDEVGQIYTIGQTDVTRLRLPFTIYDTSSPAQLATGATVTVASDLRISVNGAAYADAAVTLVEVGAGLYYYQGVAANSSVGGTIALKYASAGFTTTLITQPVIGAAGSITGSILSLTPADGSLLNPDPEIARFVPIIARLQCGTGQLPHIFAQIGSTRWTIYDGVSISPFFGDHTTVSALGGDQFNVSILPNGGWWRSSISIKFISGTEMT